MGIVCFEGKLIGKRERERKKNQKGGGLVGSLSCSNVLEIPARKRHENSIFYGKQNENKIFASVGGFVIRIWDRFGCKIPSYQSGKMVLYSAKNANFFFSLSQTTEHNR